MATPLSDVRVELDGGASTTALVYAATAGDVRFDRRAAVPTLILAHGAGAGQRSPFMVAFARALASHGIDVITFDFLYTARGRRLPDRGPVLESCYRAILDRWGDAAPLFIGGKSMGGRIATQVAAADPDRRIAGLVLLGYPLHPPGQPGKRRDAHLASVRRPMLFVQGSRDAFGTPGELQPVLDRLDPRPDLHVVEGGDHSYKLSRSDPAARAAAIEGARDAVVDWITRVWPGSRR